MSKLPEVAHDTPDDYRRFFTPEPSLPEALATYTPPTIARGIPDATAWDEDEGRIILPAHTLRIVRELLAGRYLLSQWHAMAVAVVRMAERRRASGVPDMTRTDLARLCEAATQVYHEQRAEYLAAWTPSIPESEAA